MNASNILAQLVELSPDIKHTFAAFLLAIFKHIKGSEVSQNDADGAYDGFQRLAQVYTYVSLPHSCLGALDFEAGNLLICLQGGEPLVFLFVGLLVLLPFPKPPHPRSCSCTCPIIPSGKPTFVFARGSLIRPRKIGSFPLASSSTLFTLTSLHPRCCPSNNRAIHAGRSVKYVGGRVVKCSGPGVCGGG